MQTSLTRCICAISIHALVKRATSSHRILQAVQEISIHALVKRATGIRWLTSAVPSDFNPRPREEGDDIVSCGVSHAVISIHALVKRATATCFSLNRFEWISIHALVKRATAGYSFFAVWIRYFNPRPREEGDGEVWCGRVWQA